MKFIFEKFLNERNNVVCVDGSFPAKLELSHWHGNSTPKEFKADTSTEIVFNLIESPFKNDYLNGIEIVSNNHFDADGILSAFVLLNPVFSLQHKKEIINIAETGDFSEFTTEDALKQSYVLESLFDLEKSIFKNEISKMKFPEMMQFIYEKGFELIPKLIENIDDYENIWKDDFQHFQNSENQFEIQSAVFSNYSDCRLSVIESNSELHKVSKYKNSNFEILLSAVKNSEGNLYELEYKTVTWFETSREKKIERKSFEPLAERLNLIETNKNGTWQVLGKDPVEEWDYRLTFADKNFNKNNSKLQIYEIENILFDYFSVI